MNNITVKHIQYVQDKMDINKIINQYGSKYKVYAYLNKINFAIETFRKPSDRNRVLYLEYYKFRNVKELCIKYNISRSAVYKIINDTNKQYSYMEKLENTLQSVSPVDIMEKYRNLPQYSLYIIRGRKKQGLTQGELAKIIGTTTANISWWENGIHEPRAIYVKRLIEIFGGEASEFLRNN